MSTEKVILLIAFAFLLCFVWLFLPGCLPQMPTDNSPIGSPPPFGPEWLNSMLEVAQAFSLANAASAPVNPYAFPISIALAGVTAVLEALRRKEKSGRKHAEQKLNGNNNNH